MVRTVNLDDEAYELLKSKKADRQESFSRPVKRLFGPAATVSGSAGGWSDVTEAEAKRLRADSVAAFGTLRA